MVQQREHMLLLTHHMVSTPCVLRVRYRLRHLHSLLHEAQVHGHVSEQVAELLSAVQRRELRHRSMVSVDIMVMVEVLKVITIMILPILMYEVSRHDSVFRVS